jgi:hypothetical protein
MPAPVPKNRARGQRIYAAAERRNYFGKPGTKSKCPSCTIEPWGIAMPTKTLADTARLNALLDEALALADALQLPIAAIHIDQALAQINANASAA